MYYENRKEKSVVCGRANRRKAQFGDYFANDSRHGATHRRSKWQIFSCVGLYDGCRIALRVLCPTLRLQYGIVRLGLVVDSAHWRCRDTMDGSTPKQTLRGATKIVSRPQYRCCLGRIRFLVALCNGCGGGLWLLDALRELFLRPR